MQSRQSQTCHKGMNWGHGARNHRAVFSLTKFDRSQSTKFVYFDSRANDESKCQSWSRHGGLLDSTKESIKVVVIFQGVDGLDSLFLLISHAGICTEAFQHRDCMVVFLFGTRSEIHVNECSFATSCTWCVVDWLSTFATGVHPFQVIHTLPIQFCAQLGTEGSCRYISFADNVGIDHCIHFHPGHWQNDGVSVWFHAIWNPHSYLTFWSVHMDFLFNHLWMCRWWCWKPRLCSFKLLAF